MTETAVRDIIVVVPQGTKDRPYLCPFDAEFYALMDEVQRIAVNVASEGGDIRDTHQWLEAAAEGHVEYAVALYAMHKAVIAEGVHPHPCDGCGANDICQVAYITGLACNTPPEEDCPF